jgi:hypothetical protein
MPAVKDVGEPCAGEPHARFEAAGGGNVPTQPSTCINMGFVPAWQSMMAQASRSVPLGGAPPLDPTRGG